MKKILAISTIALVVGLGSACVDDFLIPVSGVNPSALPLLDTLTALGGTVEVIGQTVTVYAFTLTPSHTPAPPTKIPDATELRILLNDTLKDGLIASLGAKITVVNVSFIPGETQVFTKLYIEMNCESENGFVCPSSQVVVAVIDSCKAKKKRVKENVPSTTQVLVISIYDPGHTTQIIEADWSDVLAL